MTTLSATTLALTVNGEPRRAAAGTTVADLVRELGLDPAKVAVMPSSPFFS